MDWTVKVFTAFLENIDNFVSHRVNNSATVGDEKTLVKYCVILEKKTHLIFFIFFSNIIQNNFFYNSKIHST